MATPILDTSLRKRQPECAFKLFPLSYLQTLGQELTRLRGRVLLFLDTCRAGAVFGGSDDERRIRVDVTSLMNGLNYGQRGLVVFSAAQGHELSQERPDWGHGAFTKALLEGLQGAADANGNPNGEITISELDSYLTDRVQELTGGAQTPIQIRSLGVPIFTFVKVAESGGKRP